MNAKNKKILVTGATGFIGKNIIEQFEKNEFKYIIPISTKDFDLLEQTDVRKMFAKFNPEIVVHLAALSGGIKPNIEKPATFFYNNLLMQTMVMHEAHLAGVKKYLTCMGGCSYPAAAPSPINEKEMWNGFPQIESAGYSVAKKMNIVQSWAYKKQFGFNSVVTIPGNLYGPYDNYNLNDSHVIPALIRKIYEAKLRNDKEIFAWGSGKPERDFVYVKDVAKALVLTLENYNGEEFFNISSGTLTTIKELYNLVTKLMDFKGTVRWETSKPDGQLFKGFDNSLMKKLINFDCKTSLENGLKETINWFVENYNKPNAIRL